MYPGSNWIHHTEVGDQDLVAAKWYSMIFTRIVGHILPFSTSWKADLNQKHNVWGSMLVFRGVGKCEQVAQPDSSFRVDFLSRTFSKCQGSQKEL